MLQQIKHRLERRRIFNRGCWETDIDRTHKYPSLTVHGKKRPAHRLSYEIYTGPIPANKFVLHSCDNPRCHNPKHLFLGTGSDNMKDMWDKKRHTPPSRRLDYKLIHKMYKTKTQKEIAKILGVSQTGISYVLNSK